MSHAEAAPSFIETLLPRLYCIQEDTPDQRVDNFIVKLETYLDLKQAEAEAEEQRLAQVAARRAAREVARRKARELAERVAIEAAHEAAEQAAAQEAAAQEAAILEAAALEAAAQVAALEDAELAAQEHMTPNRTKPNPEKYKSIFEELMFQIMENRMNMPYREPTYEELEEQAIPDGVDEFEELERRVKEHYDDVNPRLSGFMKKYAKSKNTKHHPQVKSFYAYEPLEVPDQDDWDYNVSARDRVNPKLKRYFDKWLQREDNNNSTLTDETVMDTTVINTTVIANNNNNDSTLVDSTLADSTLTDVTIT